MKKVLCLLFVCILMIITGCRKHEEKPSVIQSSPKDVSQPRINLSIVITYNNNSYIPLNLDDGPNENVYTILAVEKEFEDKHPDLAVISYEINYQQDAYLTSARTFGIWAHHRPKK